MNKHVLLTLIFGLSILSAQAEKPIRALLVTGGCCHDYDRQKLIIPKGVTARADVKWTVIQQGGKTTNTKIPLYEDSGWADGFDIVVHNECFAAVKDGEWVDRVLKPHREGLPAVLVHCSMHSYRTGDNRWFEFCGVQSPGHGPHYPFTLKNVWKDHFVMKDFGDEWTVPKGELYHTVKTFEGVNVLAQGIRQPNGEPQTSIWAHEYGPNKTRVFGTTVGHYNETMAEPTYLDMLTRGILWATKREVALKPVNEETHAAIKALATVPIVASEKMQAQKAVVIDGNLAAGKKASAKSEETGKKNFAPKAIDGNPNTRWCASGGQSGEWFQVDLGKPANIQSLRIRWEQPSTTYKYTIDASADGKDWKTIVDESKPKKANGLAGHNVKAPGTQYLRVNCMGSSGGWASIWEFEVFDKKLPKMPKASPAAAGNSTASAADVQSPPGFEVTLFGKPPSVNYPECLTAALSGEVFVGVDEQGSLGKEAGRGKVLRCEDIDGDGVADDIKTFAVMDHPRGLIYDDGKLWVLHPPEMTLYEDTDGDGVADKEQKLITGISTDYVKKRGADHTTNGIRMGIDGWIYIAVGDFGFYKAVSADGTELSRRGGGIVRVRPDGSEMEIYCWGLRNILDVSIDPYMNIFTRDNTNDGGGWNVRLTHIMQGAEYGYPSLYLNYTDEIMPPLHDYGGGSGCGAMYFHDDRWPEEYKDALYTCDWGTSKVYRHVLPQHEATYKTHQEIFLSVPRVTDIDVDGSGLMYVSSWKGGKFSYSGPDVGFVAQVRPANFLPKPAPDLKEADDETLVNHLATSPSAKVRLHAQREVLRRNIQPGVLSGPLSDPATPLYGKVAIIYTIKQKFGAKANPVLAKLAGDATLREHVLRALTDRKTQLEGVPLELFVNSLKDANPRVRAAALIGLGRLGDLSAASHVLALTERTETTDYESGKPEYAQPDPGRVLPHLAVRTLERLQAVDTCIAGLDGAYKAGALWALKYMHQPAAVDQLIERLGKKKDADTFGALVRLYHREGSYESGWWGTRPDRTGPYYDRKTWEGSEKIAEAIRTHITSADGETQQFVIGELGKQKVKLNGLPKIAAAGKKEDKQAPIAMPKASSKDENLIANLGYEDVMLRAMKAKGSAKKGKALYTSQSCIACHTDKDGMAPKGPHLVDIGKRYPRDELIESLIRPNAKIAQGFNTFVYKMKNNMYFTGFTVSESADTIKIRQITGVENELKVKDIASREEIPQSMMPEGLLNNLTPEQLADLLAYLESI